MPSRASSNGRQGPGAFSASAWKPYSVVRHSESAPPTTAASQNPASIMRAALPKTLAVDAQAQDTTNDSAGDTKPLPKIRGERTRIVRPAVIEVRRQCPGRRIARSVGQFCLQNAGGAGAEEQADPSRAIASPRRLPPRPGIRPDPAPFPQDGCCGSRMRQAPSAVRTCRVPRPARHRSAAPQFRIRRRVNRWCRSAGRTRWPIWPAPMLETMDRWLISRGSMCSAH